MQLVVTALPILGFVPFLLLPGFVLYGLLTGRMSAGGLWRDSFRPDQSSPARVYQFMASMAAATAVLIDLARSGGTAFAPLPEWLFAAAGGGNVLYLGAKFGSLKGLSSTGK